MGFSCGSIQRVRWPTCKVLLSSAVRGAGAFEGKVARCACCSPAQAGQYSPIDFRREVVFLAPASRTESAIWRACSGGPHVVCFASPSIVGTRKHGASRFDVDSTSRAGRGAGLSDLARGCVGSDRSFARRRSPSPRQRSTDGREHRTARGVHGQNCWLSSPNFDNRIAMRANPRTRFRRLMSVNRLSPGSTTCMRELRSR